jgi:hypothetical protein
MKSQEVGVAGDDQLRRTIDRKNFWRSSIVI